MPLIDYAHQSLFLLIMMVFALGIRHGFDLDHLATIDAITRHVKENSKLAKWVGFLFSLGHGSIVILMSLIVGSGLIKIQSPVWLEGVGNWISIVFLLAFGVLTLWNIVPHSHALPTTFKPYLFKTLLGKTHNPFLIILTGALFALSFDTFTQVALFSISVSLMAGWGFSVILGIIFMLGMMTTDGLNGLFVSSLIQFADKRSSYVSRTIGLMIAGFSLILGSMGLLKQLTLS